jgi:hypothetical protein
VLANEEEEHYRGLVNKLSERLEREDPDAHFRRAVRQEVDRRIRLYLGPLLLVAALWWIYPRLGWAGAAIVVVLGIVALAWELLRPHYDPSIDRHLCVVRAEDLHRLTVVADGHEAGERIWILGERQYPSDRPSIVASGGRRWEGSWQRIHDCALELETLNPRLRHKRLIDAARRAQPALEQGEAMAHARNAELALWARDSLHKLRQSGERELRFPMPWKKA